MRKTRWTTLMVLFVLFVIHPDKAPAQGPYDYLVTVGNETLRFVRRPEIGYVVVSREETTAIEALEGTLKQFGARDTRPVRGLSRRGVSVVFSQRPASENENTITMLKAQRQIKYAAPLFSSNEEIVAIIPEIAVRTVVESDDEQLPTLCQSLNLRIKRKLQFTEREYLIEVLTADASGVFDAVEQLNEAAFVESAVPNIAFRPRLFGQVIPNDTYFPDQWHLNNTGQSGGTPDADVNAPEAWEITTGDSNTIVAVLDEGVDTNHPDLINNLVPGYDFLNDDNDPNVTGDDAHGTACAGLISARGNNGIGVTGVAWNCKIMPIKIAEEDVFISDADIATAIRWAANNGADVLSNSWGRDSYMTTIHSAIKDVTEPGGMGRAGKGCVVLALVAPSGRTNLIGNLWTTDIRGSAGYNNRDIGILDYTDKMGGTSGACSIAAGVAALVLSVDPNLTNEQVEWVMERSALDLGEPGFDGKYGHGRVDAKGALELIPPPVVSEQLWVARYNGPGNNTDEAQAIAVDDSGNVYVTGSGYGSGTYWDYATAKYDPNGNELWVSRYTWPQYGQDRAYALAVDNLGNVYVTGYSDGGATNDDYATIKYDSNGNELWVARYNGPDSYDDKATALVVDDLGCVYVTGCSYSSGTHKDYATIKYDPNGNELWVARYDGPGSDQDSPKALALDNLGNVYVSGDSLNPVRPGVCCPTDRFARCAVFLEDLVT